MTKIFIKIILLIKMLHRMTWVQSYWNIKLKEIFINIYNNSAIKKLNIHLNLTHEIKSDAFIQNLQTALCYFYNEFCKIKIHFCKLEMLIAEGSLIWKSLVKNILSNQILFLKIYLKNIFYNSHNKLIGL
jgi:hypothetical protein